MIVLEIVCYVFGGIAALGYGLMMYHATGHPTQPRFLSPSYGPTPAEGRKGDRPSEPLRGPSAAKRSDSEGPTE